MADDEKSVEVVEEDEQKIDEAVLTINEMAEETVYKGSIRIGEYVLDTFFEGDIRLAASKNPKKHASFNKLCEREDLLVKPAQLALMVRVASQEEFLQGKFTEDELNHPNLTYTHKKSLVKLDNGIKKVNLVKKCIEGINGKRIPTRQFDEEIYIKIYESIDKRDSSLLQTTRKYINKVDGVLDTIDASALNIDQESLTKMSEDKIKKLKTDIKNLKKKVETAFKITEAIPSSCDELITLIDETAKKRKKNPPKVGRPKKQTE